ncbi:hypothetical protein [Kineococcus arenarius]
MAHMAGHARNVPTYMLKAALRICGWVGEPDRH